MQTSFPSKCNFRSCLNTFNNAWNPPISFWINQGYVYTRIKFSGCWGTWLVCKIDKSRLPEYDVVKNEFKP